MALFYPSAVTLGLNDSATLPDGLALPTVPALMSSWSVAASQQHLSVPALTTRPTTMSSWSVVGSQPQQPHTPDLRLQRCVYCDRDFYVHLLPVHATLCPRKPG